MLISWVTDEDTHMNIDLIFTLLKEEPLLHWPTLGRLSWVAQGLLTTHGITQLWELIAAFCTNTTDQYANR